MNTLGGEVESSPDEQLASQRLALIVDASRLLTSQRDAAVATRAILSGAVPVLADHCSFDAIADDGRAAMTWSTRGEAGAVRANEPAGSEREVRLVELVVRTKQTQVDTGAERAQPGPPGMP